MYYFHGESLSSHPSMNIKNMFLSLCEGYVLSCNMCYKVSFVGYIMGFDALKKILSVNCEHKNTISLEKK